MKKNAFRVLAILLTIGLSGFMMAGACEDVKEACGLTCPEAGIAEGNSSITGVASIDSFFSSVVTYSTKANMVADGINVHLAAIADSVGIDGGAEADFSGEFQTALKAKYALEGDISVEFQPPRCEVSAKATVEATAKCDVSVDPGSVKASCEGKCEVEPGEIDLEAACEGEAEAELTCTGTAPNLECDAVCTGTCELHTAASCEGTCKGECSMGCSVENADGSCAGKCEGNCTGTCELEAGGTCEGSCTGTCKYTPGEAECEAGARAEIECKAEASAEPPKVNCSGSCSGEVTPPSASAECEASAKAEAEVNAQCYPPSVGVSYQLTASGDAQADLEARLEFEAWLSVFKKRIAEIAAASAQADKVLIAGQGIIEASGTVIMDAAGEIDLAGDPIGAFRVAECLSAELGDVENALSDSTASLTASVQASASLMTTLGK
jgi:hypothetical protein